MLRGKGGEERGNVRSKYTMQVVGVCGGREVEKDVMRRRGEGW